MGAHPWSYFVPYQENIPAALEALRKQEFQAGRFYQPPEVQPGFFGRLLGRPPRKPDPPRNIPEAIKLTGATGTRSILDMERISDTPDYGVVSPAPASELRRLLGTDQPTREKIERCEKLYEDLDRGKGIYTITYRQGKPDGIFFAGYSYD